MKFKPNPLNLGTIKSNTGSEHAIYAYTDIDAHPDDVRRFPLEHVLRFGIV